MFSEGLGFAQQQQRNNYVHNMVSIVSRKMNNAIVLELRST